jgi:TonB family protein
MPQSVRRAGATMLNGNTVMRKSDGWTLEPSSVPASHPLRQQRLMITALGLLVLALGFVLYRDRDFWFPDATVTEDRQPQDAGKTAAAPGIRPSHTTAGNKKSRNRAPAVEEPEISEPSGTTVTTTRTVLPPLEIEVVAGNTHRKLHPSNNSIQVDIQHGATPAETAPQVPVDSSETAASVTSNAAEHADVSAETSAAVSHSVTPGYPTLARQMKVQGSVMLLALIGRDGLIQDLHVLSGPPILANAAQEAVRQWHFKPHFQGEEAVETQARITVNFTISTN